MRHTTLLALLLLSVSSVAQQKPPTPPKPTPEVQKLLDRADDERIALKDRLPTFQQALDLARQKGDRDGEGATLNGIGIVYARLGDQIKALDFFAQALPIMRAVGDRAGEARSLNAIGRVYLDLGEWAKGLNFLNQALPIRRAAGDRTGEANTLQSIGFAYDKLGDHAKALTYSNQALRVFRATGLRKREATMLDSIGTFYEELGEHANSLASFRRALSIQREVNDKEGEATTLNNTGGVLRQLSDHLKALESFNQALPIWQGLGNPAEEARTLRNIGNEYYDLGEPSRALEFSDRALAIYRAIGDPRNEAITLLLTGTIYCSRSEWAKALEMDNQALTILRAVGERGAEASALDNIGVIHQELGDQAKALEFFSRALPTEQATGDRQNEAQTLCHIGWTYYLKEESSRALEFSNRALAIYRAIGHRGGEARTLINLGVVYGHSGERTKALKIFDRVLALWRALGERPNLAATLNDIGIVYEELGDHVKALGFYDQSLAIEREIGNRGGEATVLGDIGRAYHGLGLSSMAILFDKQAVNVFQTLRSGAHALDRGTQKAYADSIADLYRELADFLTAQGRVTEAQQVLDLLKDGEYFRLLHQRSGAKTEKLDLTPVERRWLDAYARLGDPVGRLGAERGEIERLDPSIRTATQKARLIQIDAALARSSRAFQNFLDGLKEAFAKTNTDDDRLKDVEASQSLSRTLSKLPGTAAVYTLVTKDHVRTILCLPGSKSVGQAPVKVSFADLGKKVLAFRQTLEDPTKDPRPLGAELYDLLIRPVEPIFKDGKIETLIWSLDSILRYVPLWALYDRETGQYLVQKYPSALFTPRTANLLAESVAPASKAIGFGVSDASLVKGLDGKDIAFPALPGVGAELAAMTEAFGTTPKTDAAFTQAAFMAALHEKPGILHIATHFRFKPGSDADSFLVLGGNSKLTLEDFKELPDGCLSDVDLLVLSACETAVGSPNADGSEFEGFSLLAQEKGAGAVLATLWPVSDDATATLMRTFYRLRKDHPDWTKLRCLTEAQLAMIGGDGKAGTTRRTADAGPKSATSDAPPWPKELPRFSHPYYWAPFVLIGNSR